MDWEHSCLSRQLRPRRHGREKLPLTPGLAVFFFLFIGGARLMAAGTAIERPLPDEKQFLAGVFENIRAWERNPPRPFYREHRVTTDFDGDKVAETLDEIYRITWYRQQPVYVLERKNGQPLPAEYLASQEVRKKAAIDEEIAHPSDKEKIQAIYLTPLLDRYSYRIVGRETLWNRPAIKVHFDPIPGRFPEKKIASRIMEKVAGDAWVDEESRELMKAEVANTDTISIGWGILGSVSLLRIEYERKCLPAGIWFVSRLGIRAKVRVFIFTRYNRRVESTFYDVSPAPPADGQTAGAPR